jgi:hypothetical protein
VTAIPATTIDGSTVHCGSYECECFECWDDRKRGGTGRLAVWSNWRIQLGWPVQLAPRIRGTWIMCDVCRETSERGWREPSDRDLFLPLLHPDDPYARIAVEEMLHALAALLVFVRERASRRFVLDMRDKRQPDHWWKNRRRRAQP